MKRSKYYISGEISGLYENVYTENFTKAGICVLKYSPDEIISPINIKPFFGIKTWLCYMIADLYELRKCTHIAMQNNWIDSKGAVIEYFFAKFIYKHEIIWL